MSFRLMLDLRHIKVSNHGFDSSKYEIDFNLRDYDLFSKILKEKKHVKKYKHRSRPFHLRPVDEQSFTSQERLTLTVHRFSPPKHVFYL